MKLAKISEISLLASLIQKKNQPIVSVLKKNHAKKANLVGKEKFPD